MIIYYTISNNFSLSNCSVGTNAISETNLLPNENIHTHLFCISSIALVIFSLATEIHEVNFKLMQRNYLVRTLLYLLSCTLYPVFITIFLALTLIKTVISITLKIKHGPLYNGMLSGGDIIWSVEDISKTVINILLVVQDEEGNSDFIERIRKEIYARYQENVSDFTKLSCIRRRRMGYTYLIKHQVDISECVKIDDADGCNEKTALSRNEIENRIGYYSNKALPRENEALWEIILFNKPMEWSDQKKHYPILCRFSHIVGDGLSLITVLTTIFGKNRASVLDHLKNKWAAIVANRKDEVKITKLKNVLYFLHVLLMSPFIILHQSFMRKTDVNILHGPPLSGEKILVYSVEKEEKLVSMVKNMKRILPNVNFSEFILTAISASFTAYFEKRSVAPEFVTLGYPALMNTSDLFKLKLKNSFSIAMLDLPISVKTNSMLERLKAVKYQTNLLKNADDYMVNYLLVNKISDILPYMVLEMGIKTNNLTLTVSNLPSIPEISILDGLKIRDIMVFTPHRGNTGLGLSVLTYDNRFHLGLGIDKAIVQSKEDAQEISDGVLKYIDVMYQELLRAGLPTNGIEVKQIW